MKKLGNTLFICAIVAAVLAVVCGLLTWFVGGAIGKIGSFYEVLTFPIAVAGIVLSIIAIVKNSSRKKAIISLVIFALLPYFHWLVNLIAQSIK